MLGLPLSVRRLLAHAYFSKIWNVAASERLRRHGLTAAREGELVIAPARSDECVSPYGRREAVHTVTADEARSGAFDISCVVLPLPGAAVVYPTDDVGMVYRQMLSHDGVEPLEPAIERSASRHDDDNWMVLQGDYRHLLLRPDGMRWKVLSPLSTDSMADGAGDVASCRTAADCAASAQTTSSPSPDGRPKDEREPPTDSLEVAVRFDLPPGAYATMALREAMKLHPPPSRLGHIRFESEADG